MRIPSVEHGLRISSWTPIRLPWNNLPAEKGILPLRCKIFSYKCYILLVGNKIDANFQEIALLILYQTHKREDLASLLGVLKRTENKHTFLPQRYHFREFFWKG